MKDFLIGVAQEFVAVERFCVPLGSVSTVQEVTGAAAPTQSEPPLGAEPAL